MTAIPSLRDGEQKVFFKAGGEWCYLWTPASYENSKPVPVVIHNHGARGYVRDGESDWLDTESNATGELTFTAHAFSVPDSMLRQAKPVVVDALVRCRRGT